MLFVAAVVVAVVIVVVVVVADVVVVAVGRLVGWLPKLPFTVGQIQVRCATLY